MAMNALVLGSKACARQGGVLCRPQQRGRWWDLEQDPEGQRREVGQGQRAEREQLGEPQHQAEGTQVLDVLRDRVPARSDRARTQGISDGARHAAHQTDTGTYAETATPRALVRARLTTWP